ncbi:glutamine amidotransferase class-II [Oleidesulfovibrio alaskensis G20]|jgi:glutamate synthase domain-containing protein 1|uniref:Glutamine amidotransferase class-II n=1 Tax=Oleidesulfovibrio alaskensis (strain ATCC BAA-1058 / DSM 17464 / G20) TaxID=207559 RepID=Q310N4_OLEA2|nr:glutamine amidotransferase family protein [Oleidesulfovibrio alaskensis]ABB38612.1 glutamine amidotransferase class-II [Oleidesulfovibrio alaskensis G20]MBG0773905.1 glutamine amidotransferase family protein [Oleidesulfovibrio alaskensis]MBL3581625.1 glutamine amidotransferase family protein [Oleidesulfovibrio alaskensis]MBL3588104.1 glutamine amidotransferase family protein [bacterium]
MKAPDTFWQFDKDISGCGVFGVIDRKKNLISGSMPISAMCTMHDRGNGLGGGFAAYGIYPHHADKYAFHLMCDDQTSLDKAEKVIKEFFDIAESQPIPTRKTPAIKNPPIVWRFFVTPRQVRPRWEHLDEADYVVSVVMHINKTVAGAFVFSSGKNMGAFKGVGFPEDIADFFRLDEYNAYIWTGHNRFPTNTPGWWGGAHPFTILDWAIVHNGEISSYGINKRYLCQHDYECTLMTDTEVVAYLLDLLIRKHGLSKRMASRVFAPPFWDEIDRMPEDERRACEALRMVYGSAMLNGPFAILVTDGKSMMGLNDRVKLRPLIVAEKDDMVFMSSEESSIREVCPELDRVWAPKAGEPVIVEVEA